MKLLFALPLALILAWAIVGAAQTNPFSAPLKAEQLVGLKVEDTDGQKIGVVHNLVLDMRGGELKYVVIGSGGLLGVRPTLRLAPSRIMSAATTKRATLAAFTTVGVWNAAPVFKASALASLEDAERSREISRYFQTSAAEAMTTNHRSLSRTGVDTNTARPELKFASDIVGMRVVNQKQEKIGEILDILVGFGSPHPAFAVIGSGRLFRHGQEYAVPLSALKSTERERKLLLETDDVKLEQAPLFTEQTWKSPTARSSVSIYRYSKTEE